MFEFQLAFRGDKDGILGPAQIRDVGWLAIAPGRLPHARMCRHDAAHAAALVEQDPACTIAAPGEIGSCGTFVHCGQPQEDDRAGLAKG
jgi:hypothetical protein